MVLMYHINVNKINVKYNTSLSNAKLVLIVAKHFDNCVNNVTHTQIHAHMMFANTKHNSHICTCMLIEYICCAVKSQDENLRNPF